MSALFRLLAIGSVATAAALFVSRLCDSPGSADPALRQTDAAAWRGPVAEVPDASELFSTGQTTSSGYTPAAPVRFVGFPLGERKEIEVAMDSATRDRLTPRERRDQVRDWLLLAVLSDAGLTADQFNRVSFDLPPVRHGHFRPVANFEYGETRACHLGEGDVVAVVPAGTSNAARRDHLAHVADEYRKTLGRIPRTLLVFQYQLLGDAKSATLTRTDSLPGDQLFAADYGYTQAWVSNLNDFTRFMSAVQDITFARLDGQRLELGGRKLLAGKYRGLRVEDVAAVWQAQDGLNREREAVDTRFAQESKTLRDTWNVKLNAELDGVRTAHRPGAGVFDPNPIFPKFPRRDGDPIFPIGDPDRYGYGLGKTMPKSDPMEDLYRQFPHLRPKPKADPWAGLGGGGGAPKIDFVLEGKLTAKRAEIQKKFNAAQENLLDKQAAEYRELKLSDGTGFSLDPEYDYDGLAKYLETELKGEVFKEAGVTPDAVDAVVAALKARKARPYLELMDQLKRSENVLAAILAGGIKSRVRKEFEYQAGRYDGPSPGSGLGLQGTAVGMTLFYTDLLAKLWESVDYDSPKKAIPDFRSSPDGGMAPIYKQQTIETPGTRLWFGKEDRAFQLTDGKREVLFARRATRIFAASSNDLTKENEIPPIQASEHTLGWWNDHYEEIARHEPEYERLNEYMKWSLVLSWLTDKNDLGRLDFLRPVSVDRSNWFPDWVKKPRPDGEGLKFTAWNDPRLAFHPKGHVGTATEAMKILFSRPFDDYGERESGWVVSGGVSGGRPRDFATLPAFNPRELAPGVVPGKGLVVGTAKADGLTTLRGTEHAFKAESAGVAKMTAVPKPPEGGPPGSGTGLRPQQSTHGQLKPTTYERTTSVTAEGVRIETTAKIGSRDVSLGEFTAAPTKNGFRVGHVSRELDAAMGLGRELSSSGKSAQEFLSQSPMVERTVVIDGNVYVQLAGSKNYYRFTLERKPTATVPVEADARVADVKVGAKSYDVATIAPENVLRQAESGSYVQIPLGGRAAARPGELPPIRGPPLEVGGGKPPANSQKVTLDSPEGRFPGEIDGRTLWVKVEHLPAGWKGSPGRLHDLTGLAKLEGDVLKTPAVRKSHPAVELMEQGRVQEAFELLQSEPLGFPEARGEHLGRAVEAIDRLLIGGRPADARVAVDLGKRVSGDAPELLFRQGLADLASGNSAKGVEALNRSLAGKPRRADDTANLFNEVNRKLAGPTPPTPAEVTSLVATARAGAARDLKVTGQTKADVEFTSGEPGGPPRVKAGLGEAEARPVGRDAIGGKNTTVYVEDAVRAELGTGPAVASRKAIFEGVSGGKYELFELHQPDAIVKVTPDRLGVGTLKTPDGGRADIGFQPVPLPTGKRLHVHYNPGTGSVPPPNDDDTEVIWLDDPTETGPGGARPPIKRRILIVVRKGTAK